MGEKPPAQRSCQTTTPKHFCRATLGSRHAGPSGLGPRRTLGLRFQARLRWTFRLWGYPLRLGPGQSPGLRAA